MIETLKNQGFQRVANENHSQKVSNFQKILGIFDFYTSKKGIYMSLQPVYALFALRAGFIQAFLALRAGLQGSIQASCVKKSLQGSVQGICKLLYKLLPEKTRLFQVGFPCLLRRKWILLVSIERNEKFFYNDKRRKNKFFNLKNKLA